MCCRLKAAGSEPQASDSKLDKRKTCIRLSRPLSVRTKRMPWASTTVSCLIWTDLSKIIRHVPPSDSRTSKIKSFLIEFQPHRLVYVIESCVHYLRQQRRPIRWPGWGDYRTTSHRKWFRSGNPDKSTAAPKAIHNAHTGTKLMRLSVLASRAREVVREEFWSDKAPWF